MPVSGTSPSLSHCGYISLETDKLCTLHSRAAKPLDIGIVIHVCDHVEVKRGLIITGFESRFSGRCLKAVPRTNILTDVAAVDPAIEILGDIGGKLFIAKL